MAHLMLLFMFKCWSRKFALLMLPAVCFANNPSLAPFSEAEQGLLFTAKGSNTVGAQLLPGLAEDFLRAKGLVNVGRIPLAVENEVRIQGFLSTRPATQPLFVDIAAHGSSTGFVGLQDGSAQLAMASRPIKAAEAQTLGHLGDMTDFAAEKVVAIDGLAIIVHPKNPLEALTIKQVADIFTGKITNWQALGGRNEPIKVAARDENSGTWDTFKTLVLAKGATLAPGTQRFESNDQLAALVSAQPGAIGFVGLASVNRAKALRLNDEGTEPLAPSALSVATEDYILSRRLFLYKSPADSTTVIDEFIQFAQSAAGQARVKQVGYVSQHPRVVAADLEGVIHQDYLATVRDAERLSVNIRFKAGSAELDNKAKQDVQRLAQVLKDPAFAEKTPLLIGFGDAKGSDSRAKVLSKLRATRVKAALYELGVSTAPVAGFGAIMPVAATDKVRNQRVEIWLK
ncbi:phosphate ABC transporter substrate-binding/OmpA family protein [Simiduia sp. 21SJ11W-1]|uniref:substrate-binding domain-containing protein n=1 Tax=Simiduia sp. 21SJ11W-1 TaxID=2909669 RepID=UPI00209CFD05|nr:phosphate ABC transporter substrate-binding/OmpA family protein [Simiduia sp. 21SJ11W-1]UTA46677.1 phosphate ABC transporter substrate-binding/OmpA family protein [Simiduia sp. 21SJ11W-1]